MLKILKGKRLVFVGDSLNRNMWESLVCSLRESLVNKSRVFEASGRREFRTQGFYSFRFQVLVVQFYTVLVQFHLSCSSSLMVV